MRLKFFKDKDHNGGWTLTTVNGHVEEGEVTESPDAYADHKAMSNNLRKRKRADDTTCRFCMNLPSEENTLVPITSTQRSGLPAIDFKSSDQVFPPLNWSMTAKRGMKDKAATKPKYEEESEDPLINAAYNLLLLASGISLGSSPMRQQQNINSMPYDSRVMNNGDDLKISTQLDSMNVNSTSMEVNKTEGSNQNINKLMIQYNKTGETLSNQSAIDKPTKKMDGLEIVTDLASDQKQNPCNICNKKSFSSHQALGGHTTSHYKSKSNSRVGMVEGIKEAKLAESECLIGQGGLPIKVSEHRCNICGLTFPTGQALGGHKRKHWPGPKISVASSSESARKASDPYVDMDLNKPPPDLA